MFNCTCEYLWVLFCFNDSMWFIVVDEPFSYVGRMLNSCACELHWINCLGECCIICACDLIVDWSSEKREKQGKNTVVVQTIKNFMRHLFTPTQPQNPHPPSRCYSITEIHLWEGSWFGCSFHIDFFMKPSCF